MSAHNDPSLFALFTEPLNALGIDYMVTGSVAGIVFGEPRLTHDVDLVLALAGRDVGALHAAFPIDDFYCPPVEVIETERARTTRGHFNLIHHATGFKADIYLKSDALHDWGFSHRIKIPQGESVMWVAPPEYVIIRKLEYFKEGESEKHLRDIAMILSVSQDRLDNDFLEVQVKQANLESEWVRAQEEKDKL